MNTIGKPSNDKPGVETEPGSENKTKQCKYKIIVLSNMNTIINNISFLQLNNKKLCDILLLELKSSISDHKTSGSP